MVNFDYEKFNSVTHCHVCEKLFSPDDTRVHDHLTGTEVLLIQIALKLQRLYSRIIFPLFFIIYQATTRILSWRK